LSKHSVHVEVPEDIPLVYIDPVLFEQIFINLFENASKYTPTGTRIDIRVIRHEESVSIEVRDNGPGVPAGLEEKLFEKFYRGPQTMASGAGLGLPICRGIAEAHGGSIRAQAVHLGGISFQVVVPVGGTPPPLDRSTNESS